RLDVISDLGVQQRWLRDRSLIAGSNQVRPGRLRIRSRSSEVVGAIDRPVDGSAHGRVVREQSLTVVERNPADTPEGLDPEPSLVDAVPVRHSLHLGVGQRPFVQPVRLDHVEGGLLVEVPLQVEAVEVPGRNTSRASLPVGVPAELRQAVDVVEREGIGRCRGQVGNAPDVDDLPVERELGRRGLEERHREDRDQLAFVRAEKITSFILRADTLFTLVTNCAAGDWSFGLVARSKAYSKLRAVTGVPSLNRKPLRRKKVYRLPRFETVKREAPSGTSFPPGRSL